MAKGKDDLDRLEPLTTNLTVMEFVEKPVSSATYSTKYMLDATHQNVSIAYEVARRFNCSLKDAVEKYQMTSAPLKSVGAGANQAKEAIKFAAKNTTHEKPTIIMVNYKVGITGIGSRHWAPIIVSKDKKGKVEITHVNSNNGQLYKREISGFQKQLVKEFGNKVKVVVSSDASRNVQIDNVCGFASADAASISIKSLTDRGGKTAKQTIDSAISKDIGQQRKKYTGFGHKVYVTQKALTTRNAYVAQGQRSFAVMEYLNSLKGWSKMDALEKPILEIEKVALEKAGHLSSKQSALITDSTQLDDVLTAKIKINKLLKKSSIKLDDKHKTELYNEAFKNSFKSGKFNEATAKNYVGDHLLALKLQKSELKKVGIKVKGVQEIVDKLRGRLTKYTSHKTTILPPKPPKQSKDGRSR